MQTPTGRSITVTLKLWVAFSPPGSLAVTTTVALPTPSPRIVTSLPDVPTTLTIPVL